MGSIMSAISDDIDHYEYLCDRYGEKVQYSHGSANPYGSHCDELKWKLEQDKRAEQGLEYDYLELCERFGEEPRYGGHIRGGGRLPEIQGYYAKLLEDRARIEDGKPPRSETPGARAVSYVTLEEMARKQIKTRFDRI